MLPKRRFKLNADNKDEENLSDISDISCPEPPELQPSKSNKPKKTRHKFTHTQDKGMLKYIMNENRYNEIKGIALWKDMEILQITNHSKQSMKYRFLKTVIPNLHQYEVPKGWVDKLNRLFPEILKKNPDKENAKTNFPLCSMLEKWKRQSPGSPRLRANDAKKTAKESDVSEEEETSANYEGCNTESTFPYTESPLPHRRRKRHRYKQLQFDSSSESEAEEEVERNVSAECAAASTISPDPSPSKSAQELSKEDSSNEQSELSDYDEYLMGIAKKKPPGKKSSRSDEDVSQSDKANTTNEDFLPESEEEMDQDDSIRVPEDRRSRLQHRRHLKKVKKAFGEESSTPTSPHKKGKKPNLAEFVINSHPEEGLNENTDVCSPEKACEEISEYETTISDIAESYGLTNREVLSTIFSFNGNIEKTIAYIRLGPELSQLKPWSEEEDQIISSTDEPSIKKVAKDRGNKFIAERLQFLENFSEDLLS